MAWLSGQKAADLRRHVEIPAAARQIASRGKAAHDADMVRLFLFAVFCSGLSTGLVTGAVAETPRLSPPEREAKLPRTRWDHVPDAPLWTRAALSALKDHGRVLPRMVPADIADWCPAYGSAPVEARRAFWVGFLSALVKHESTYRSHAVGGGGRWYGLTQIQPSTARLYGCRARNGTALKHGPDNLSCAVRIMARTVPRDGVVSRGMRGVAADWGPLHSSRKRQDMMAWTRSQSYCRPLSVTRPRARPDTRPRAGRALRPRARPERG
jgi:hypothetical protein